MCYGDYYTELPPEEPCDGVILLRFYVRNPEPYPLELYGALDVYDLGLRPLWSYSPWHPDDGGLMLEGEPSAFENLATYLSALVCPGKDICLPDVLAAERFVQRIRRALRARPARRPRVSPARAVSAAAPEAGEVYL